MKSIRMLREKKRIAQIKLAEDLHVNQSTISKWENGHASPGPDMLEKIASYFDVPIAVLFQRVEDQGNSSYGESAYIPVYPSADDALSHSLIGQDLVYMNVAVNQIEKDLYFAYCVNDDAYFPDFWKEDILVIKRTEEYKHGDIVLVSLNYPVERPGLCRLRRVGQELLFIPCGQQTEPVLISEEAICFYYNQQFTAFADDTRKTENAAETIKKRCGQPEQIQEKKVCFFGKAIELRRYLSLEIQNR